MLCAFMRAAIGIVMNVIYRKNRSAIPRIWLFTDERVSDATLLRAIARLPHGAGIIFRHYSLPDADRRALFEKIRTAARKKRLVLILADTALRAQSWQADGWHQRSSRFTTPAQRSSHPMLSTRAAHSRRELIAAQRSGADAAFVSPIFATRSHPGSSALGRVRLGLMIRGVRLAIMALGGMNMQRAKSLHAVGITGWGAIDALSGGGL
jgi:thiamine-phosphate pyrophosphorylase